MGMALDAARKAGVPARPWVALILGLACAAALSALNRTGRLSPGRAEGGRRAVAA